MLNKKETLLDLLAPIIRIYVHEGRLREFLKKYYYHCKVYRKTPCLDKIISKIEVTENSILSVELYNGMKFYGEKDEFPSTEEMSWIKYGDPRKMSKIKDYPFYGSLWQTLSVILRDEIYENYYQLKRGNVVVDIGAHIKGYLW